MAILPVVVRQSLQQLRKAPGLVLAAVLSLGLGIGASVTVATWLRQTVLSPLPGVPDSGALVAIGTTDAGGSQGGLSHPDLQDLAREVEGFQGLFAGQSFTLGLEGQRFRTFYGSWNQFEVLGIQPALGRFFNREDDRPGAPLGAVLSDRCWRRVFGADPAVVGRRLHLGSHSLEILGVAPAGFHGPVAPDAYDLFLPLEPVIQAGLAGEGSLESRSFRAFWVLGRPAPGVSLAVLARQVTAFGQGLARRHPGTQKGVAFHLYPITEMPFGSPPVLARPMALLLGTSALLLLLACANVANLLMGRALGRTREAALRAALGADPASLFRLFFAESLCLGVVAGLAGLGLAALGIRVLPMILPDRPAFPMVWPVHLDLPAMLLAGALALATPVVFGTLPALRLMRAGGLGGLREGGSQTGLGRRHHTLQGVFLVLQAALAATLLGLAALLAKSAWELARSSPGFRPQGLLHVDLGLDLGRHDAAGAARLAMALRDRVAGLPGVLGVTFTEGLPLGTLGPKGVGVVSDRAYVPGGAFWSCKRNLVGADYFRVMQIPLVAGRDIREEDRQDQPPVVVVNETLARRTWPGEAALGRRLRVNGTWREVVGVSADSAFQFWTDPPTPFVYLPQAQWEGRTWNLLVRVEGPPEPHLAALARAVEDLAPELPVLVQDMSRVAQGAGVLVRLPSRMLLGLGILAMGLAGMGVAALTLQGLRRRTREFGIRAALGAGPWDLLVAVARAPLGLTLGGLAVGAGGAVSLGHLCAPILYRTRPVEPLLLALVLLGILGVVGLVILGPALRVLRIPPADTLRSE